MQYKSRHTALAWSDARTAALYFDRVIPVNVPDLYRVDAGDPIYYEVLQGLLPETLLDPGVKIGVADPVKAYVARFLMAFPQAVGVTRLSGGESLEQRAASTMPELLDAFGTLVARSGVSDFAVYGEPLSPAAPQADADPCLVLSNLDLVDASQLTWRQILELRRDADSVERLRNLRRLVYEKYDGKSEAYIRDDIESRIADYASTSKLWGLPLQKGVLEIAMTAEALQAAGSAVALALFGVPVAAAAAAGGAITIAKAALAIAMRKRDIELERRRNPIAYLVKLRSMAGQGG